MLVFLGLLFTKKMVITSEIDMDYEIPVTSYTHIIDEGKEKSVIAIWKKNLENTYEVSLVKS